MQQKTVYFLYLIRKYWAELQVDQDLGCAALGCAALGLSQPGALLIGLKQTHLKYYVLIHIHVTE